MYLHNFKQQDTKRDNKIILLKYKIKYPVYLQLIYSMISFISMTALFSKHPFVPLKSTRICCASLKGSVKLSHHEYAPIALVALLHFCDVLVKSFTLFLIKNA